MSYDVSVVGIDCKVCEDGYGHYVGNYTYNCSMMLVHAISVTDASLDPAPSLSGMNGWPTERVAFVLDKAITEMNRDPDTYRAMNPANGWGNFETWKEYLSKIMEACHKYPGCKLVVS